jgi:hypothetical protein
VSRGRGDSAPERLIAVTGAGRSPRASQPGPHFEPDGAIFVPRETIFPTVRSHPETERVITSHHSWREIGTMIILKITALVLGAGMLVEIFSQPDFSPDFVLAIVACFL